MTRGATLVLVTSAFAVAGASAGHADAAIGGKTVDCYCTDRNGARVELGQSICLQVDGRMFTAQCQMSLNVPMWREVAAGCLSSSAAPQLFEPPRDPGLVDPRIRAPEPQPRVDGQVTAALHDGGVVGKPPQRRARDIGEHALVQ